jgi:hypothetical protein
MSIDKWLILSITGCKSEVNPAISSNEDMLGRWLILSFLAVIESKSPFGPNVELAIKARVRLCYLEL